MHWTFVSTVCTLHHAKNMHNILAGLGCSDRSRQMSDPEQIAQVAQDKWEAVSESLRSLMTNERPWAITKNEQMSDSLKKFWLKKFKFLLFSTFYLRFFI